MLHYWPFVLVMPLLAAACSPQANRCHCGYNSAGQGQLGCFIEVAAPQGFRCKCTEIRSYRRLIRCEGTTHPCRNDESCPGDQYSYCACDKGGGNCQGYPHRPEGSCDKVNQVEAISSQQQDSYQRCSCEYYSGGCRISKSAPDGFKCSCTPLGFWTCSGNTLGCNEDEYCPADDYSYCGCRRGGGNCDGYRHEDRNQRCEPSSTCDCNLRSDWTKGRYSIHNITFNTDNITIRHTRPVTIKPLEMINTSEVEQSKEMTEAHTETSESSFQRTHGVIVAAGLPFSAIIPGVSLTPSTTNTFTYGRKTTTSKQYSYKYTCKSPPNTHTRCRVFLLKTDKTIPYTMFLKHNVIPDCACASFGSFETSGSLDSTMKAETIGPCHSFDSGECVTETP